MNLAFLASSLVGCTIEPGRIHLAQLRKTKYGFSIECLAKRALPAAIFAEGKIKAWDLLHLSVAELVQEYHLDGCKAALSLPINQVQTAHISMPSGLSHEEKEAEIIEHVQRNLPGMVDTLAVDYLPTEGSIVSETNLFFAVARKEYIKQYINCINSAGLEVKIIDIEIYALKRAFTYALGLTPFHTGCYAVLYAVDQLVIFMLFNARDIVFYHSWEGENPADLVSLIKSQWQIATTSLYHLTIQQFAIFATDDLRPHLTDLATFISMPLSNPDLFAFFTLQKSIVPAISFAQALGLAMRDVPKW